MDRGRAGLRHRLRLPADGGRDLHDLHLPRRLRHRLRQGCAGLLHPLLHHARLRDSYWLLPPVWRFAKERRLFTQPDFFAAKYESPALGMLVALVGLVALVPYMVLQFKGLGIIVSTASLRAISPTVAVWIGAVAVTAYVVVSGVHGSAWNACAQGYQHPLRGGVLGSTSTCRCITTVATRPCSRRSRRREARLPGPARSGPEPDMVRLDHPADGARRVSCGRTRSARSTRRRSRARFGATRRSCRSNSSSTCSCSSSASPPCCRCRG